MTATLKAQDHETLVQETPAQHAAFEARIASGREDRAGRLDARRVPPPTHPHDLAARAQRGRRDAAGRRVDQPCAESAPQTHSDGQGAGRGRARAVPLPRRRDAGRDPRGHGGRAAERQGQVFQHLQLPDRELGRRGHDRLAGGRRGHQEPDHAGRVQLRPLLAGDGPHLLGGDLPPQAGQGNDRAVRAGHPRAAGPGARRPDTGGGGRA